VVLSSRISVLLYCTYYSSLLLHNIITLTEWQFKLTIV